MSKLKHNRTWYLKKLVEKAKRCVKERDNWTCQRCGKVVEGANCHASHILNVGAYKSLELDPSNMKVLCGMPCHLSWWHKNPLEAAEWFNEKFPDRYFYLKEIAKKKIKIPTVVLAELHENTKADGSDYGDKYYKIIKEIINV